jgi:phospholipid-binding lipoprotein MlaA
MAAGRRAAAAAVLVAGVAVAGCATGPSANPRDPLEPLNRRVDSFNTALDDAVLKPVATAYRDVVPQPLRTGVSNFFGNIGDAWSLVNALLQGRLQAAAESFVRVSVNTVFGLGGLLDIAGEAGVPRHNLDFGLTLGRWGVPAGPYVVLPLLGPSSVRDSVGLAVDSQGGVLKVFEDDVPTRNSLYVLEKVDLRARLLRATDMLGGVALDRYSFTRDVYLQRRDRLVSDLRGEEEDADDWDEDQDGGGVGGQETQTDN